MNCQKAFAENMKRYRQFFGLSQEALANRCGLDMSYIGRIERQVVCPTTLTIQKICDALNVEASLLFSNDLSKEFNDYAIIKYDEEDFKIVHLNTGNLDNSVKEILDMLCDC